MVFLFYLYMIYINKQKQNYGFRTRNFPAVVEEVTEFECDLQLMIKNVVFKNVNIFQKS